MPAVRRGEPADLAQIRAIQAVSPHAAQWDVTDYLQYHLLVAVEGILVAGFLVSRTLTAGESEILNVAVAPEWRRQGVARALLDALLADTEGAVFLEVRASNTVARSFYKSLDFHEVTTRMDYYENPPEPAIVMKFHSC
ncbi:MAG TPA: ribosomal protein S18-alanine N-acetyltransferase [Bryobacteraceae bacterium]|jgi:ribosomal-protein-alanine N-acetyltransferase|nr:ribosomal protein S18-alanine N-acetyltransferase [Bryobacteraceae bacterium]